MVNAAGAEALKNRTRRGTVSQQKARATDLGYDVTDGDFVPAKNKKFPYYRHGQKLVPRFRDHTSLLQGLAHAT